MSVIIDLVLAVNAALALASVLRLRTPLPVVPRRRGRIRHGNRFALRPLLEPLDNGQPFRYRNVLHRHHIILEPILGLAIGHADFQIP